MAADHTLILVHGMGSPTDTTFKEWEELLSKLHDSYVSGNDKFSETFNCVSVNYDSIFKELRENWNDQISKILDGVSDLPSGAPTADNLEKLTDDNFFTEYIMDVLLYRFVPLVAEDIRTTVNQQILDGIRNRETPGGKVSIISYSLGTSVVHDSLNQLFRPDPAGHIPLSFDQFRFHCVAQIANVSRTLETKWDVYNSFFKPGTRESDEQEYVATRMFSASHVWDPLVSLKRFTPPNTWPNNATASANRFRLSKPEVIRQWNIHAFSHYLNDPNVHIPLFRLLRRNGFIQEEQAVKAIKTFNEQAPIEKIEAYKDRLQAMISHDEKFSWKKLIKIFKDFGKLVKEFTE